MSFASWYVWFQRLVRLSYAFHVRCVCTGEDFRSSNVRFGIVGMIVRPNSAAALSSIWVIVSEKFVVQEFAASSSSTNCHTVLVASNASTSCIKHHH